MPRREPPGRTDRVLRWLESARNWSAVRVDVVLAAWDETDTVAAIDGIRESLAAADIPLGTFVVVANSESTHARLRSDRGLLLLRGSNERAEFSAYAEGLRALEPDPTSVTLVANDRLMVYSAQTLRGLHRPVLALVRDQRVVVGQVDGFERPPILAGRPVPSWIRSNFFLISGGAPVLRRFFDAAPAELHGLSEGWPGAEWAAGWTAPSTRYRDMLQEWLVPGAAGRPQWDGASRLTSEYWPTFRRKVTAIVTEHLTSRALLDAGYVAMRDKPAAFLACCPAMWRRSRLRRLRHGGRFSPSRAESLADAAVAVLFALPRRLLRRP